jgi:hypothetical protein
MARSQSTDLAPTDDTSSMTMTPPCESVVELALNALLLGAVCFVALALVLEFQPYLTMMHAAVHDYLFPEDNEKPCTTATTTPPKTKTNEKLRWSNARKREAKTRG